MSMAIKILTVMMFLSLSTVSSPVNAQTDISQSTLTEAEKTEFLRTLRMRYSPKVIENMAIEFCGIMQNTRTVRNYPVAESIERNLLRFADLTKDDPKHVAKIAVFWNHYLEQMICPPVGGTFPRQHFYKRAIELSISQPVLIEYFFRDSIAFPIEVNIVEIIENGSSSTVIDYIDAALAMDDAEDRYNVDQVEALRTFLIEKRGAKSFSEM